MVKSGVWMSELETANWIWISSAVPHASGSASPRTDRFWFRRRTSNGSNYMHKSFKWNLPKCTLFKFSSVGIKIGVWINSAWPKLIWVGLSSNSIRLMWSTASEPGLIYTQSQDCERCVASISLFSDFQSLPVAFSLLYVSFVTLDMHNLKIGSCWLIYLYRGS